VSFAQSLPIERVRRQVLDQYIRAFDQRFDLCVSFGVAGRLVEFAHDASFRSV